MAKYAVIRFTNKQYKVEEGQEILVDKLRADAKSKTPKIEVKPEVLLLVDDKKVKVGKPVLKDIKIKIKVLEEVEKGKKLHVYKFKAKSRYRRKLGFRPQYTRLLIEKIS
jgi:large subunit ribosomal protein L21